MENNFKKLNHDKILNFEKNKSGKIQNNLRQNVSLFKLIGNFFELFLFRQVNTLTKMIDNKSDINPIDSQKKPTRYPEI